MNSVSKNTLKFFIDKLKNYKWTYFSTLFFITLGVTFHNIIYPIFFKEIVDLFSTYNGEISKTLLASQAIEILLFTIVLTILGELSWRLATFCNNHYQPCVMRDIENDCYEKLESHSYSFFANSFTGALVTKVNRMSRSFEMITDAIQWDFLQMTIKICFSSLTLLYFSPFLGTLLFCGIMIYMTFTFLFYKWKYKFDIRVAEEDSKVTASLADGITNMIAIKTFSRGSYEKRHFYEVTERRRKTRKLSWQIATYGEIVQGLLLSIMGAALLYYSIILWRDNVISLGVVLLVEIYAGTVFFSIWGFGRTLRNLFSAFADAKEMTEILYLEEEVKNPLHPETLKIKKGAIEFDSVDFAYEEKYLFKNFSIKIPSGQSVGLVGHSGAGKSTLLKLLLRFSDVNKGKITIDGQDISKITQNDLHESISYIPQEPILFHRTLRENIAYAKEDASEEEIIEAAKKANIHDLIESLPLGYNTLVGERGVKLSGGERQRVIIARALLKDAPVLILDEATSALDSHSEKLIQESLKTLMKGKTTIAIAHRLSTIQSMDRILVMDKGQVVEEGSHKSLLRKKKGVYKELWSHQAGGFLTD